MNKKRTLEKRILSALMAVVMAGSAMPLPVFAEENTTDLKVSELTKEENDDMLYSYYYHADTDKRTFNQNDSIEFDGMDHSSDTASAKVYMEGKWVDIVNKDSDYKAVPDEGEWLISDLSESSTSGEIRFVHRYVEPKVYLVRNSSNILELKVGEADSNGMALAPITNIYDDEFTDFYSGLDVRVRKTVDKLENGSFRISITGRDGTDYTRDFEYYDSERCNVFWQRGKWINAYDTCLGAIPDEEVAIYIRPEYDLLHVKAGVADGGGGSISPADAYYEADSMEPVEYTVTPDEGYELEKIEATDAYGNPAEVTLNENTGKYEICPSNLRKENTERSTATIQVYFRQKHIATVEVNGTTKVFDNFEEALAYAVGNNGSTLRLFDDVNEKVAVKTGSFTLDAAGHTINAALNVGKGAELTVNNAKIAKNTICATGGKLLANGTDFAGTVNCTGEGVFNQCNFAGAVSGRSVMTLSSCGLGSTLSVSGNVEATASNVVGEITVNNNGNLTFFSGNYQSNIVVKSGGTMQIEQGEYGGIIQAQSGSTLTVSDGNLMNVQIQESANAAFSGGTFGQITVAGKPLMECLADGKAFEDVNLNEVIDGRVGIAGNVRVISHTHSCIWSTNTHEKLCGCGYVESTDSEAPVISGIEDGKTYYGEVEFSVTDANDFTVTVDGNAVIPENGKYTIAADNAQHTIVATDVAGNTVSVIVTVRKLYTVTLPSGTGYTVTGANTAGNGTDYEFKVKIAKGYSKTENYQVLVNGMEIDSTTGDETGDTFVVTGVNGDMTITVEGVADITPPEAEIEIGTNKFNSFLNAITFKYFFKKTQNVTVTASDNGSGLSRVEYLLSETAFTDKEAITGDWTELTLTEGRGEFDIEADQKAYVYLRVTDASGNVKVINSEGVVVYTDSEAVTEAVSFIRRDDSDVSFDVRLNGNTVAALYNGDTFMDSDDYTVSEDGTITLKNDYISNLAAGEYTIHVTYNPMGEEYRTGDEPAMTSVKLTVEKRTAKIVLAVRTEKTYDGDPIDSNRIDCSLRTDGTKIWEYKPAGEDDSAYSSTPPKNAGVYIVRLKTAETDDFKAGMATTTFEIMPKELTIKDLRVKDKQYDGKNTAEIDGTPALVGVVEGDVLELVNGIPTFESVTTGRQIPVSFTRFTLAGDSITVGNYTLIQPEGITADIVEYTATGDEYSVNSNDWINTDFVITAEQGYQLSLTDTADGEWSDTLTASDETDNGRLIFYVKNITTGAISATVTENYKIDRTKPTGEVRLNERNAFQESVSKITFDLFFREDVHVKLTAKDEASGVKSVRYYKSEKVLTDDKVREITDWTDNSDFDIKVKDRDKFIIYVRIEDNAGNVTYIGSDGVTFDTTAPEIVGVDNGKTYYVTKKVMIDDENFESVTLNSESVENGFTLTGDTETTYAIRAVDKAGNVTESTVYMKPISSVTDTISDITVDHVKASDADTISAVEGQILEIMEAFDDSESTEDEWNKLTDAAERCKALKDCISAAKSAAEADEITAVDGITKENVKSEDKNILEKAEKALENALRDFDGNYTEEEKRDLEGKLETVKEALAVIEKAEKEAEETNKNSKLPSEKEAESSKKGEAGSSRKGAADSSTIGKEGSVRTGDTGNLTLWIALLFISGGIAAGIVAAGKKKKDSVK